MEHHVRSAVIGLAATMLAVSSAAPPTFAETQARHHRRAPSHRGVAAQSGPEASPGDAGVADAARNGGQARGLYAGAGGIFSPAYEVPNPGTIQLGAQLLGGDFGKAYEDYYRHYYYYKYAYCPIGTGYVIYSRSCVGLGNLFQ